MLKVPVPVFYQFADSARTTSAQTIRVHCPNPSHYDHNPSCGFNVLEGNFKCYSCGITGQLQDFVILAEKKLFKRTINEFEALRKIARITHDILDPQEIKEIEEFTGFEYSPFKANTYKIIELTPQEALIKAHNFFQTVPKAHWNRIRFHYMQDERHFPNSLLDKKDVRLNYSSCWPVLFPIEQQGEFKGYIARLGHDPEGDETKYKNNPGFLKSQIVGGTIERGCILLVEGWLDLMRAISFGFSNVACTFGWFCSDDQAKHILQYATSIIVAYDNDASGEKGYQRAKTCFASLGEENIYRMKFPQNVKDVDRLEQQWFTAELLECGLDIIPLRYEYGYQSSPAYEIQKAEQERNSFLKQASEQFHIEQPQNEVNWLPKEAEERVLEPCL